MRNQGVKKSCVVDGKKVWYWIYNPDGQQTILAIHGLRGTHHGMQFIAEQLPQYSVVAPDLPGHGESEALNTTHSADNFARFLERFSKAITLPSPCVVIGHSFGSSIVGRYAKNNPAAVKKLILINPVVKGGHPLGELIAKSYYRLGGALPEKLGTKLLRSRLNTRLMTLCITMTKDKTLRKRVYQQHLAYFSSFSDRQTVRETFQATMTELVADHAQDLTMPTLMIVGAKDRLAPMSGQQALHRRLQNAEFKVIPHVGHLIHYETPELAAEYIKEFVG